ncbi:DUF2218 domain-containing protein [Vibrio sp. V39_P1S14PM300]|uniref:DUF2218 domain-containing protein n=1 Tax=Vibrio sp. V39_P1S14PM300 TaxID=1938690 RepID=UPI0013736FEC|nr:DUF2218 domain-containing protein [Vibrio sp. V39_P1S14PM300]NAX22086.1 DUF2218 domain-containing protein [Vibrio sp. V39_P1S14PM300]
MLHAKTHVHSEHVSKYLVVLCRHFARKVHAQWDEWQGIVHFPVGTARMEVDEKRSTLSIFCEAEDDKQLAMLKQVLEQHMEMFARREAIVLIWD